MGLLIDHILEPCCIARGEKVLACHDALNSLEIGINDLRDSRSIEIIKTAHSAALLILKEHSMK